MKKSAYNVAIVGATGAVGEELLGVMERRSFPVGNLKLLASARSAGKPMEFRGKEYSVEALRVNSFEGVDIAFFSAGGSISKEFVPVAVDCGADGAFAKKVLDGLVARGLFVRKPGVAPMDRCIRVSAGTDADMDLLAEMLPLALADARA